MAKYYALLLVIAGGALYYVFLQDPCNRNLLADFSSKYPDYEILDSAARDGSTDAVNCHVSYIKPDSEKVYEDVWLYRNQGSGWSFSEVIVSRERE